MVWPVILSAVGPALLRIHAHNARIATSKDVADELWRMATKYQDQAAKLGEVPKLGDKPPLWKLAR
jgi:hypothetical protein